MQIKKVFLLVIGLTAIFTLSACNTDIEQNSGNTNILEKEDLPNNQEEESNQDKTLDDIYALAETISYKQYKIDTYEGPNDITTVIIRSPEGKVIYNEAGLEQKITIKDDKLYLSSYDELAGYVEGAIGEFNYYRVDYELVEKDGKFEANKVKVDYEDIRFTATT